MQVNGPMDMRVMAVTAPAETGGTMDAKSSCTLQLHSSGQSTASKHGGINEARNDATCPTRTCNADRPRTRGRRHSTSNDMDDSSTETVTVADATVLQTTVTLTMRADAEASSTRVLQLTDATASPEHDADSALLNDDGR